MRHNSTLALAALVLTTPLLAQSLAGVKIGDPASKLDDLGTPASTDEVRGIKVRKWVLPNGNQLSVTTALTGHIVYIESNWGHRNAETACGIPSFRFGVTTLADIRKKFGSNGFTFSDRGSAVNTGDAIVLLNSYEAGSVVVTFSTKTNDPKLPDSALLDAISLADADYATSEWGERIYDPNYKKIDWK